MNISRLQLRIRIVRLLLKLVFRIFFRVRVEGLYQMPNTPSIVAANHLGWADPFLVLLFLPVEPRIYILGEEQVKSISRFRTFFINRWRVMIPLNRSKPLEALRTMKKIVTEGGSLLIFPEGHLGETEGTLLPLQSGAAHISLQTGAPIVPVGLTGTSSLWLRKKLTIRVGAPLNPEDFNTGTTSNKVDAMTEDLANNMAPLIQPVTRKPRIRLLEKRLTNLF